MDYGSVLSTVYFRPNRNPLVMVRVNITDDSLPEGDEAFTLELTAFDVSVVIVNGVTEVVIGDDEEEISECGTP